MKNPSNSCIISIWQLKYIKIYIIKRMDELGYQSGDVRMLVSKGSLLKEIAIRIHNFFRLHNMSIWTLSRNREKTIVTTRVASAVSNGKINWLKSLQELIYWNRFGTKKPNRFCGIFKATPWWRKNIIKFFILSVIFFYIYHIICNIPFIVRLVA